MPYGDWINELPTGFFLVVHIAAFALGAGFAWLAFKRELALLGTAFSLFAAAELVYMTYHLDWTVFLFAHTIAEVLDLTAFVLVFAARRLLGRPPARARGEPRDAQVPPPGRRSRRARSRRAAAARATQRAGGHDRGRRWPRATASTRRRSRSRPARRVTWTNDDNFTHTVQVDGQEDHKVGQGESVSITFDKPGTYHYVCTLHSQDMDGEVIVK